MELNHTVNSLLREAGVSEQDNLDLDTLITEIMNRDGNLRKTIHYVTIETDPKTGEVTHIFVPVKDQYTALWCKKTMEFQILEKLPPELHNAEIIFKAPLKAKPSLILTEASPEDKAVAQTPVPTPTAPNQIELELEKPKTEYICGEENSGLRKLFENALKMDHTGKSQGRMFNAIVLYGPSGVGKETLLKAVTHKAGKKTKWHSTTSNHLIALHMNARDLISEYGDTFGPLTTNDKKSAFNRKYSEFLRFFCISRIERLCGKRLSSTIFLADLINKITSTKNGGCVVLSLSLTDEDLTKFEDPEEAARAKVAEMCLEMREALEGFNFFPVEPPGEDSRRKILEKLEYQGLKVDPETIDLLAKSKLSCLRIIAEANKSLMGFKVSKAITGKQLGLELDFKVPAEQVMDIIASELGVSRKGIRGAGTRGNVLLARRLTAYILIKHYGLHRSAAALELRKDDRTVDRLVEDFRSQLEVNQDVEMTLNLIKKKLT